MEKLKKKNPKSVVKGAVKDIPCIFANKKIYSQKKTK
jgi:hypothetical protein